MKRLPPPRTPSLAFTLVELTVSLAIVGILAGLLMAGLGQVRENAASAGDVSNLRQIGVSLFLYLGDHNRILPPIIGPKVPNYVHETLALQMGLDVNFRDPTLPREAFGIWISPHDKRVPPKLSPLRSYSVNYYLGEITGKTNSATVYRYAEISNPSQTLYFVPADGEIVNPTSQARFSELTPPFTDVSGDNPVRFNAAGVAPVLWADGHVTSLSKAEATKDPVKIIRPKRP